MDDFVTPQDPPEAPALAGKPSWDDTPEVPLGRERLVKQWTDDIRNAEKHWKKTFDRMRTCRQLARDGALKDWLDADSYVVPIIPRHINTMVSALYAKDPRAVATQRKKLMYTLWDGSPQMLQMAVEGAMIGDPNAMGVVQEIDQAKQYQTMIDKLSKALILLWEYFTEEQRTNFKSQMKALVRRTKINGVGYLKLGYQRVLKKQPEITAGIQDATSKIADIEARLKLLSEDDPAYEEDSAAAEELRLSMADLQAQETIIVREGPTFDFPRSDEIVVDTDCRHLKTFAGARWVAHKFDMTPDRVLKVYKVDVKKSFTRYFAKGKTSSKSDDKDSLCRVWEVQDIETQMCFVVCDGYPDFLKEPYAPDVKVERFWTLFPLVFNEVEGDDGDIYPPSDAWLMRHPQFEYNRVRQGLREHRMANRPKYVSAMNSLEDDDKTKLTTSPAHSIIEIAGMTPGEKIADKVQRMDMIGIDPNMYQVEEHFKDTLRAVGSQEANMGSTSGDTATETSIAEQGRQSGISDQVDELDDFLTEVVKATTQLMLLEITPETAKEIAGPGTPWPAMPQTREEIVKDLYVTIKAGSSGRPNQAAELAKIERAAPYMLQLPGVSPEPLAEKYATLLDIDMDELYTAGMPSITALNAMAGKAAAAQAGTGDPATDPASQGGEGGDNEKNPQDNEGQSQPAYPTTVMNFDENGNMMQ
jgi:hypothetical protein